MTIRAWKSPRATVGKRYRIGALGSIEVDAIDSIALRDIQAKDARQCGFESVEELADMVQKASARSLNRRSEVYRVRFHFVGQQAGTRSELSIQELQARLERMDSRSSAGPWTRRVLKLIERKPGVSSARLAGELDWDRMRLKAEIRKLKKLGLTNSLEIGYELTKLGRAVVRL